MESLQDAYAQLERRHTELQRLYDILKADSSTNLKEDGAEAARFVPRLIGVITGLCQQELYSDVTIEVDGHHFPGHRLIMVSHSDHWGNMAGLSRIELEGISLTTGENLLKWYVELGV
jgi:BTB/POZ domain